MDGLRCDGLHQRESSEGKLADGTFRTSPLAQYPEGLCRRLGELVAETLARGGNWLGELVWRRSRDGWRWH